MKAFYKEILLSVLLLVMLVYGKRIGNETVEFLCYLLIFLPVGIPVIISSIKSLAKRDVFNEYTLMSIASIGAFAIGEYPEAVAVMLFYSIGEELQELAVAKARGSVRRLLDNADKLVTVYRNGVKSDVLAQDVHVGDILELKIGERLLVDGKLYSDCSSFDTSAVTGEHMPRIIKRGEDVYAGMISLDSVVKVVADKAYNDSLIAKTLSMVMDNTEKKSHMESFVRRISRVYTPVVVALAVAIVLLPFLYSCYVGEDYNFDTWLYRALVFMVISCPCAIVISVPLCYYAGLGRAAREGMCMKGSEVLDSLVEVNTFAFDKTGTLTEGKIKVDDCQLYTDIPKVKLLSYAASLEKFSTHPVAKAVYGYAMAQGAEELQAVNLKEIPGMGLNAIIDGHRICIGNISFLRQSQVAVDNIVVDMTNSQVYCSVDNICVGSFIIKDSLRKETLAVMEKLRQQRINEMLILSGDRQNTVNDIAARLNIKNAYGNLLPDGKVGMIEKFHKCGSRIAYVGDGLNDAPVMSACDVSFSMGGCGNDVAVETSSVVITNDNLMSVANAVKIARSTRKIVWENIIFALLIKLVVVISASFGCVSMWIAVFADTGVALLAVVNALRLSGIKLYKY